MEWPKRARTADWENGVLTLDGDKQFDIPELDTIQQAAELINAAERPLVLAYIYR